MKLFVCPYGLLWIVGYKESEEAQAVYTYASGIRVGSGTQINSTTQVKTRYSLKYKVTTSMKSSERARAADMARVLVLTNTRSGLQNKFGVIRRAFKKYWEQSHGAELFYQFSDSKEDGERKARRAVEAGFNAIIVAGGDGTVSTIGRCLVGTPVSLGVIPCGSGNGFARHFEIPLAADKAVAALAQARPLAIDVGLVNHTPFFVTCSMAWDAAIVRSFERYPIRGIVPYILAGVQEFFDYTPQNMVVTMDDRAAIRFEHPIVFTVANLSQFGGGARIAPNADPRDGELELVVGLKQDAARLMANLANLFNGQIDQIRALRSYAFRKLTVLRETAAAIQIDGELAEAPREIVVQVAPRSLQVLAPG